MAYAAKVKMWKLVGAMAAVMVLVLTFCAGRASAVPQPNMEAALGHLEQARVALEKAEHNKGGFRVKALGLCNQSIAAVREAIAVGNK